MKAVLLTLTLVLLMAGLTARAWAYEQASLSVAPGAKASPTLGGAFGVGNEPSPGAATPSVRVPTSVAATHSAAPLADIERTAGAPVTRAVTAQPETLTGSSSRTASTHANWPTPEAMRWQPPRGFLRAAFCIHRHESVDWYRAYVDWRGQPSVYSGGLQFTLSTWRRAGGSGHPHEWRPREQVYRAFVIWRRNGGSWREWGTAWKCGLT